MISGLGIFEILIILLIVLMFFGSKELPHFIKESAKFIGKIKRYSEKVRRELNEVTQITDSVDNYDNEVNMQKNTLRKKCLNSRKSLSENDRKEKSVRIAEHFYALPEYEKFSVIMMYVSTPFEVQTRECIAKLLEDGKRVILPYCLPNSAEMGIAEIHDFSQDLVTGKYDILEPRPELHGNFLKSDLQLVVCPGVGFDEHGARLGHGKGYYDYFLNEIKDRLTIVGFAYQCQVLDEPIPFDYHDVPVTKLITEQGLQPIT